MRGSTYLGVVAAFVGAWLLMDGRAEAASFDCAKAASRIEHLICDTRDLSSLDSQLEGAYLGALDRSNHPPEVKAKQLAWLKQRDACLDAKCMTAAYSRQIQLLSAMSDEPAICAGATTLEINGCLHEYSLRAERELARYVAAARKRLMEDAKETPDSAAAKTALVGFDASEAAWATYRKAECSAVYDLWSDGTIRGAMYEGCWKSVTKSRSIEIWSSWLSFMDDTPPLLAKPTDK